MTSLNAEKSPALVLQTPGEALHPILPRRGGYMTIVQEAPVAAGPIWMRQPHPAWCTTAHDDSDHPGSRECMSEPRVIALSLADVLQAFGTEGYEWTLDTLHVSLEAAWREVAPRITAHRAGGTCVELTLDEAETLRDHLTVLLAAAGTVGADLRSA